MSSSIVNTMTPPKPIEPAHRRAFPSPPAAELRTVEGGRTNPIQETVEVIMVGGSFLDRNPDGTPVNNFGSLFLPGRKLPNAVLAIGPKRHYTCISLAAKPCADLGFDLDTHLLNLIPGAGSKSAELDPREAFYVPLINVGVGDDYEVFIRPERTGTTQELMRYREAVDWLDDMGIPRDRIRFLGAGSAETREHMRMIGCVDRLTPIIWQDESIRDYIQRRFLRIATENRYYYTPSEGTRRISADGIESMLESVSDRSALLARMKEVADLRKQMNTSGQREVDFLLFNDRGLVNRGTEELYNRFTEIYEFAESRANWGEADQSEVGQRIRDFVEFFRGQNPESMRRDDFHNHQFLHGLYKIVRGYAEEEASALGLGAKFSGQMFAKPGGFIGQVKPCSYGLGYEYVLGPEERSLNDGTPLMQHVRKRLEKVKHAAALTIDVKTLATLGIQSDSVFTVQLDGMQEGRVNVRRWVFDRSCDAETKHTLNDVLAQNPTLDYAYVCENARTSSKRDVLVGQMAGQVRALGPPGVREVRVIVFKREGGVTSKELDRRLKHDAQYFTGRGVGLAEAKSRAREYEFNHEDRVLCLRQLGISIPSIHLYHRSICNQMGVEVSEETHGRRAFIDGPVTNRMDYGFYRHFDAVQDLLKLKGSLAGACIIAGFEIFDNGDQVISGFRGGIPSHITQTDPTSAFMNVNRPLSDDTPLYAISLAGDLIKLSIMGVEDSKLAEMAQLFTSSMRDNFRRLQRQYHHNTSEWEGIVQEKFKVDVRIKGRAIPKIDEWDMLRRWPKALKRLDAASPEQMVKSVEESAVAVFNMTQRVIHNLTADYRTCPPEQTAKKLKDMENVVELLLVIASMNHRHIGTLMDSLDADTNLHRGDAQEKLMRLGFLRAATWIRRMEKNPESVRRYALQCGIQGAEAKKRFCDTVNKEFRELYLSPENAESFYDVATNPTLYDELTRLGYVTALSRTQQIIKPE